MVTGRTYRINLSTGEYHSGPYEDPAAELERELKKWKWNAEHWECEAGKIRDNMRKHNAYNERVLTRVASLVNLRRKTVRMDDLREALYADFNE